MKLLIVEDDLSLSDVLSFTLRRAGFQVVTAYDGLSALLVWEQQTPDLLILDLNLPKLDGLEVCKRVRAQSNTPIIILSVRSGDEAIVSGLEQGADDYIVKPFSPSQLVARVRAVLRRVGQTVLSKGVLENKALVLDRNRQEVQLEGQTIRLTPLELKLLEALMLNEGQVLTTDWLIDTVWGAEGGDKTMLKQLVYRLRTKIEQDASNPNYIETVPGVGYAFKC